MRYIDLLARQSGYKSYNDYLRSKHWRSLIKKHRHATCYCCDGRVKLNLHHTTYERLGKELPQDLITVCSQCHKDIHRYARANRGSLSQAHLAVRKSLKKRPKPTHQPQPVSANQSSCGGDYVPHWWMLARRKRGQAEVDNVKHLLVSKDLLIDAGNEELEPSERAYKYKMVVIREDGVVCWSRARFAKMRRSWRLLVLATQENSPINDEWYFDAVTSRQDVLLYVHRKSMSHRMEPTSCSP